MVIFIKGFVVSLSLIVAIGAQNAFVLSQGVQGRYPFVVALICATIDLILISIGVAGIGLLISSQPELVRWITLAGAVFLTLYGLRLFLSALKNERLKAASSAQYTLSKVIALTLAVSLLNPHVYLDTMLLIGSIGAVYDVSGQLIFVLGASMASFLWFFSLSYGARALSPVLAKPKAWQIMDTLFGVMMCSIAWTLWQRFLS
jgi:L-lysine exporter family protein LysE/ArgO